MEHGTGAPARRAGQLERLVTELPENASALTYSLGFVMATGLLHAFGIAVGVINRWPLGRHALRGAGALVALGGIFFLVRALT